MSITAMPSQRYKVAFLPRIQLKGSPRSTLNQMDIILPPQFNSLDRIVWMGSRALKKW
nr:hypothetical protein Iba_chr02dCG9630 [Ipomoea batatas]